MFYGLGSDGTIGANKNSIKIIGEDTPNYVQGYFVYDSKKAGVLTVSHLRFGPQPIRSAYFVDKADFVACHVWSFLERYKTLLHARPGATYLLNCPYPAEEVWDRLPYESQARIIDLGLKVYAINAYEVAKKTGMGGRINTIMQTCFFYLSGIIPPEEAIGAIKATIKKTYGKRGDAVVQMNYNAVDQAIANLHEITYPNVVTATTHKPPLVPGRGAGVPQEGHRAHHGRPRALLARVGPARRRGLAHRHHPLGEAQHRPRDPGVGPGSLHPVRQVLAALPARHHPHQGLRPGGPCGGSRHLQVGRRQGQGERRPGVDRAGGSRGLHRLRRLRGDLPGQRQGRSQPARPSTWRSSRRCGCRSETTTPSSWASPTPTAPRCG